MHLLTTQLESQRKFWEDQLVKAEKATADQRDENNKQLQQIVDKNTELLNKVSLYVMQGWQNSWFRKHSPPGFIVFFVSLLFFFS